MSTDAGYDAYPELAVLYDDVTLYKVRSDIEFYVGLCRDAGAALELGCGTGRVLIPAAQAGCAVTGVDQSKHMLARCRAKAEALPDEARRRVTLVESDFTSFRLDRKFPLVIVPFRPFQHIITAEEQMTFLRCVREHLEPGGRLVMDLFNPNLSMLVAELNGEEIEDTPETDLPDGRRIRRTYRFVGKHHAEQCNDVELIYYLDGRRLVHAFPMRYCFRFEVEHLLARAGFEVTALYGNFDCSPFGDKSPEMIFTATRVE